MNARWLVGLTLCGAHVALAQEQEQDLSFSVGVRAWYTEWTTFSYYVENGVNLALTQSQANDELALTPIASVRYGKFSGSISAFLATDFSFVDGSSGEREELDLNFGYAVTPALTVTLGYKKVEQGGNAGRYRPAGPVVGVNAVAPLGGLLSLYGSLGIGVMDTPSSDDPREVQFEADYRLAELGLAYTPNADGLLGRFTFTGGYRIQVLDSKDAFPSPSQDGRDTTQGFTLGAIATF